MASTSTGLSSVTVQSLASAIVSGGPSAGFSVRVSFTTDTISPRATPGGAWARQVRGVSSARTVRALSAVRMDFTGHSISGTTTIDYPALTHAAHWITRERNPADGFFKPAANQVVMKSAAIKP